MTNNLSISIYELLIVTDKQVSGSDLQMYVYEGEIYDDFCCKTVFSLSKGS